jgi:hypothetical protein
MKSRSSSPYRSNFKARGFRLQLRISKMNRRPRVIAGPVNYALKSRIVLQQGHALGRKIKRLTARCCRCEHARITVRPGYGPAGYGPAGRN